MAIVLYRGGGQFSVEKQNLFEFDDVKKGKDTQKCNVGVLIKEDSEKEEEDSDSDWLKKQIIRRLKGNPKKKEAILGRLEGNPVIDSEYNKRRDSVSWGLALEARYQSQEFQQAMDLYINDVNNSDGFHVKHNPPRDALCSLIFSYYDPPHVVPGNHCSGTYGLNNLLCLSKLAICVYNNHQKQATYYDNVQVLRAMVFGSPGPFYNITFEASSRATNAVTFQTRVFMFATSSYHIVEIRFVRKLKGEDCEENLSESDYNGDDSQLPLYFVKDNKDSEEELYKFDEKDYTLYTDSMCKLPLYLSELALNEYNIYQVSLSGFTMEQDEMYGNVSVLSCKMKSSDVAEATTYLITFEASLPDKSKNVQIFQTKILMSPPVPTTKIEIKFVMIKPN